MRVPLIAGNWKMNKTAREGASLASSLRDRLGSLEGVEVAVAPPFTALHAVGGALSGSPVRLAAQDIHWEPAGAFTGEVSAGMLQEAGVTYVIVGHSERRSYFGETNASVSKKAARCLESGLTPIVCVGETLADRDGGRAFPVVQAQLEGALAPLGPGAVDRVVVAYEPVWAIGTGRTASEEQVQEVHSHLRGLLASMGGEERAAATRILYGGSVKPDNIRGLMAQPDVDGALVGGASLDAETFASIALFRV